ncbi:MAG: Hsp20/alpha crystallin family protein [Acidobacteria bacterium]|nr:Hsp20/alpha crystallin family protein [Acidobacteriota bacterium]
MGYRPFDPFEDLTSFSSWKPPIDVCETDACFLLRAEVPGVERSSLQLRIHGGKLQISGERKFDRVCEEDRYQQVESFHGKFSRTFLFPTEIDRDAVAAVLQDGVLTITLPKRRAHPVHKKVKIEDG